MKREETEARRQRIAAYMNCLTAKEARARLIEYLLAEEEGGYDRCW